MNKRKLRGLTYKFTLSEHDVTKLLLLEADALGKCTIESPPAVPFMIYGRHVTGTTDCSKDS